MRLASLAILGALALACGGPATPRAAPGRAAQAPARPKTPRDALVAELRRIERPARVLDGLGRQARADLDKMVAALGDEERSELARAGGPWPKTRPLLHLIAGGDSADAYFLLATTSHAGEQLVVARQHAGGKRYDDLVASTRGVVERAAARWLRDRAVEASSPERATAELCDQIDRAAVPLDNVVLRRRARELAAIVDPKSQRHAAVAQVAAWELDLEAARSALERARATAESDTDRAVLPYVERVIATAEKAAAARGKTLSSDEAVQAARAQLRIGRPADARATLAPHAASTAKHLGIATTSVMAKTDRIVCPGMPAGVPSSLLCAVAWSNDARVREAIDTVERAWGSRGGRDEESIGAYLGIAHFVPWLYGTYLAGLDGSDASAAFGPRIEKLRGALTEAIAVAPAFEGVGLFVDSLAGLYEAGQSRKPGERIRLPEALQKKLVERATALSKREPGHRYTHAGVLAVAASLSQERDIRPIEQLLPREIAPDYALPRNVMRLWSAVADKNVAELDEVTGALTQMMPKDAIGVEGARLVLLMSEARAAVLGGERELEVLERIASQLTTEDVPTDVRLRAAIDRAGALARRGRISEAEGTLEGVISKATFDRGSTEADIAMVAYGYLLVLKARNTKGEARVEHRDKLAKLDETAGTQLPVSALVWRDLWLAEIDRLIAEDKCGAMKACKDRIAPKKPPTDAELAQRLGATSAKVMASGVLAAGSMNLTFAFSSDEGLTPVIVFEPRLLAVELPPRSITNR